MIIIDCGQIGLQEALELQNVLVTGIVSGCRDETLLLLEHQPVYTIGSNGNQANVLDHSIRVERISRGGDVTWHGPGQLVGYPLVDLGRRGRDLHRWLRFLEELLMATLSSFGIDGRRIRGATGVWSERGKIGFIGVGVHRWVTRHGFSLNINPDLNCFAGINPCGLSGCRVSSMEMENRVVPSMVQVKKRVGELFARLLNEHLPLVDDTATNESGWNGPWGMSQVTDRDTGKFT